MDSIKIGKITAPVGIKGEVRVYAFTDEVTRFSQISEVLIGQTSYGILSVRYQKGMVVLKLDGVEDRSAAEGLRGKELFLSREDLWDVPQGTYFIRDLIGMTVRTDEGIVVGTLTDVIQHPSQDLYEISKSEGDSFLLPAVSEFVLQVDIAARIMTVRLIEGMMQ
jgi:16S rRNA processing protein RimM